MNRTGINRPARFAAWILLWAATSGCQAFFAPVDPLPVTIPEPPPHSDVPRELAKTSLPAYVLEPPDVLLIQAIKLIPKGPHFLEPFDALGIRATGVYEEEPIFGAFSIDPDGNVELGVSYGKVQVVGKTIDEAKTAILTHLQQIVATEPQVSVTLVSTGGSQPITGQHLVAQDGTVNLGTYGNVHVAGMTIQEAKRAVEEHLAEYFEAAEVLIDVFAYNSKVYYVITEGAGFGDNVRRIPVTGSETVLDAISLVGGLSQISSKRIWIARPAPNGVGCEQVLEVDWNEITRGASTSTNYQLMPGDRLFVAEDKLVALDAFVSKVTRPFERILGFNILGTQMIGRFRNIGQSRQVF